MKWMMLGQAFGIMVTILQASNTIKVFNKEYEKGNKLDGILSRLLSSIWFTWLIFCTIMLFDIKGV
jgi:hypothetical protein